MRLLGTADVEVDNDVAGLAPGMHAGPWGGISVVLRTGCGCMRSQGRLALKPSEGRKEMWIDVLIVIVSVHMYLIAALVLVLVPGSPRDL